MKLRIYMLLLCCILLAGCTVALQSDRKLPVEEASTQCASSNAPEETQTPEQNADQSETAESQENAQALDPITNSPEKVRPNTVDFTDGPGGATTVSLAVGDSFLGFTMTDLEWTLTEGDFIATFIGNATLHGRLRRNGDDEMLGSLVFFEVSTEYVHLLPYHTGDERIVWFGIQDNEMVRAAVGNAIVYDYPCEIVISSYEIQYRQMMAWNGAKVKELRLLDT